MINNVTLVGRLTKDPQIRTTPSGVEIGQFSLAVNRNFSNNNGQKETDFIQIVVFRKQAQLCGQYLHKGTVKWDMPNKALVIEQLEQRGFDDLVKVKKDVNLAEMKNTFSIAGNNVVDSNGELLEGAYISVNPRTYSVKVD